MSKLHIKFAKNKMLNGESKNHMQVTLEAPKVVLEEEKEMVKLPKSLLISIDISGSMDMLLNDGGGFYKSMNSPIFVNAPFQPLVATFDNQQDDEDIFQLDMNALKPKQNNQFKDVSFSNSNKNITKLESVKLSAKKLIDSLDSEDYFGVVLFDDNASVFIPLQKVGTKQQEFKKAIDLISTRGCTNIYDSLTLSIDEFEKAPSNYVKKLILLSDGEANSGITSIKEFTKIASLLFEKSIITSTIGFGMDYNLELMSTIANKGGGNFYHIKDTEEIFGIIEQELNDISVIKMKNAEVKIKLPHDIMIEENLNGFEQAVEGNLLVVKLGNLRNDTSFILPIELLMEIEKKSLSFNLTLSYNDKNDNLVVITKSTKLALVDDEKLIKENEDIIKEVLKIVELNAKIQASIEIENKGSYMNSKGVLSNAVNGITAQYATTSNFYDSSASLSSFEVELDSLSLNKNDLRASVSTNMRNLKA